MNKHRILASCLLLGFLLSIHKGRIALWKDGQESPCHVFPYPVAALPRDARQALEDGIPIDSEEDLSRFLESFCS